MRPVYTLEEARETDHRLVAEDKLDETALIDSAAAGAYNLTKDFLKGRICVAVGPGNNGSDGLEYAYLLFRDGFIVPPRRATVNEKRGFFGAVSHFRHIHPL